MLIRAFVPAHITAFFVPVVSDDPVKSGSLGAGVNLDRGTTVFAGIETGTLRRHVHVAFNGEPAGRSEAVISYSVVERIVPKSFVGEIEVWQYFDFPSGYGFGNSAGGALGTALALGYEFGGTLLELGRIAHTEEVRNGGGLGDVIAQIAGGVEIRVRAGGPGIGVVDNILTDDLMVVAVYLAPLKTRSVLDSDVVRVIDREGREALKKLMLSPKVETMMKLARNFAERTGLMDDELRELARSIESVTSFKASMIMLGRGVFSFVRKKEIEKLRETLSDLDVPYAISNVYWGKPIVGTWNV